MDYILSKQIFYINSSQRTDPTKDTNTSFSYVLDIDHDSDYTHVAVLDCSIPKSAYSVGSNNNTFTVTEEIPPAVATERTITMPVGNYTRDSFRRVLKEKLNDNVDGYVYDITYENINLTQDTGKYTYTWTNTNGSALDPIFTFTTKLFEQTGFDKNSTNSFVSGSLISTNVVNLKPESTYFILSDICQQRGSNVLQNIISLGTNDYNFIIFQNPSPQEYSKLFVRNNSNIYWFKVVDENYNAIDLNGINVVMTIMLYKKNEISNLIKGYIKYKTLIDSK